MSGEVRAAYNEWAASYDSEQNKTRDLESQAFNRHVLSSLASQSNARMRVLELGCGTGKNSLKLITCDKVTTYTGLDFSAQMLAVARSVCAKVPRTTPVAVDFVVHDLCTPWHMIGDSSVDLVAESLVLEHLSHSQLEFVAAETSRVLRPGGQVYLGEFHPFRQYLGAQARGTTIGPVLAFVHHMSDFLTVFRAAGVQLCDVDELFDVEPTPAGDVVAADAPKLLVQRGTKAPRVLVMKFEKVL